MKCTHNDCFTCPYDDCICDLAPKGTTGKRKKLTQEEAKARRAQYNKKYYDKNRSKYQQLHRDYYRKKKGMET